MRALAKKYAYLLQLVIVDPTKYPNMAAALGLRPGAETGLSIRNPESGDTFPFTGKKITSAAAERFLDNILEGKVQPWTGGGQGQGIKHEEL